MHTGFATFASLATTTKRTRPACHSLTSNQHSAVRAILQRTLVQPISNAPNQTIQKKIKIGPPDDRYEKEADRVADQVVSQNPGLSTAVLQNTVSTNVQRLCDECEETPQQKAMDAVSEARNPNGIRQKTFPEIPSLTKHNSNGRPLPYALRQFYESRMGRDFRDVRLHTDNSSTQSAEAINARAYTLGNHITFNRGQYQPGTTQGRHLLAHELTHVVQQGKAAPKNTAENLYTGGAAHETHTVRTAVADTVQRACGSTAIGAPGGCTRSPDYGVFNPSSPVYKFDFDCDTFKPGEDINLENDHRGLPIGTRFAVHGFASVDGNPGYNHNLACARALAAANLMMTPGPLGLSISVGNIDVFNHGPTPGPVDERRSVTIEHNAPAQPVPPEERPPLCGPDATQWLIDQMNAARTDAAVLAIQADITAADGIARRHGITAHQVAEGATTLRLLAEEALLQAQGKNPARNPTINLQIAAGSVSGAAVSRALRAHPIDALTIANHINNAATAWAALVTHGARYDFKLNPAQMHFPRTANCPEEECDQGEVGIITLCPGMLPENCYQSDLPGNLFFSRIGQFAGFSELTLQLGSQFAELLDTVPRPARPHVTWDSPEDTSAIHVASSLTLPLTRSSLCSILAAHRGSLSRRNGCRDCTRLTTAVIT
ncbi:DUF4157 domain-containing protein [Nitrosomonas marina]|uniref:eCIS core domain-containing protein n=1 Tax=Nitrosomonas marina TaxID=917 RepID=A0A1H8AB25_9PROT|nr:DUF4157 domain-containing protein [Nitrosomonas marina]SEM68092.1 protein of unknown function [Nitrosomonas marina]